MATGHKRRNNLPELWVFFASVSRLASHRRRRLASQRRRRLVCQDGKQVGMPRDTKGVLAIGYRSSVFFLGRFWRARSPLLEVLEPVSVGHR